MNVFQMTKKELAREAGVYRERRQYTRAELIALVVEELER